MADKLLVVTEDSSNVANVYVGDTLVPANLVSTYNEIEPYRRCRIHMNGINMLVGSSGKVIFSSDGGATWTAGSGTPGAGPVLRQLTFGDGVNAWQLTMDTLYQSTDLGATWVDITPGLPGTDHLDLFAFDDNILFILKNKTTAGIGGQVHMSNDGGSSWMYQGGAITFSDYAGWDAAESPRRIVAYNGGASFVLLTSHSVWRFNYTGSWSAVILWKHAAATDVQFPLIQAVANTGYFSGTDRIYTFDDLQYEEASGRIWLGGDHVLRAHSFDGVNFYFSDIPAAANQLNWRWRYWHRFIDSNTGFALDEEASTVLLPHKSGLYKSVNGGVSTSAFKVFSTKEEQKHLDAMRLPAMVTGCTIPTACNYDAEATADDGSCLQAVILTDCSTMAQIHTSTPEIVALACRKPRWGFDVQGLVDLQDSQAFQLIMNGAPEFLYNSNVLSTLPPDQRVIAFLQGLIAYINGNTSFVATLIPQAQNTFVPNSPYGVWIYCGTSSCAGLAASLVSIGLAGITSDNAFDSGASRSVVTLAEFPGRCFSVCGTGDCAQAQTYTLVGTYPNCITCLPSDPPGICKDCDRMVAVGNTWLFASDQNTGAQCFSAGQTVGFHLNGAFPDRTPASFTPVETGNACTGIGPLTLTFTGNHVNDFPVGSQFTCVPSGTIYTVATATYDTGGDITTVTTTENCQDNNAIVTVQNYTACGCGASVVVTDIGQNVDVLTQNFTCINNQVQQDFTWIVPQYGLYRIVIQFVDCGSTRTCTYWFKTCDKYTVENIDCHQYRLNLHRPDNMPLTAQTTHVRIKDLKDGSMLLEGDFTDVQFPFIVKGAEDTVYTMEFTGPDTIKQTEVIIDSCVILMCRKKMVLEQFCGDDDPCDNDCEDSDENDQRRLEITRVGMLMDELQNQVYTYRQRWTGLPLYSASKQADTQLIADLIGVIRETALRCGACSPPTTSSDPCPTC